MTNLALKNQGALPIGVSKAHNTRDIAPKNRGNYTTGFTFEQALEAAIRRPFPTVVSNNPVYSDEVARRVVPIRLASIQSTCLTEAKIAAINWLIPGRRLKALA